MHAIPATRRSNSAGSVLSRVGSLMPTCPPRRSTRKNSLADATLSGKVQKAHSQITASKAPSANGRFSASPRSNCTRESICSACARDRAAATFCSPKSMPKTSHPNSFARKTAVVPLPQATSRTQLAGRKPSMRPSSPVNCKPPGWNESPSRNRARSLSYSVAQQVLTCACSGRTRNVWLFVAISLPRVEANKTSESSVRPPYIECDGTGLEPAAFRSRPPTLGLHCLQLSASLFAIADGIVGAKRNLFASRQEKFLAALHEVLLIEGPRVHEILQHDHQDVLRDVPDGKAFWNSAGLTRHSELLSRFLRTGNRR